MDHITTPSAFFCSTSLTLQSATGGGGGCYPNLVGERGREEGGAKRGREVGLITDPSAFALRRIRQPYLLVML